MTKIVKSLTKPIWHKIKHMIIAYYLIKIADLQLLSNDELKIETLWKVIEFEEKMCVKSLNEN